MKLTKITKIIKKPDKKYADAHNNFAALINLRRATASNMLELGRLFKESRDKKYYKLLDYESFNAFCAAPEVACGRSTIYSFIHIYEKYVLKLEQNLNFLCDIGHYKLQLIQPVVDESPLEWLDKAKELSPSDLKTEIREAQGKPVLTTKLEDKASHGKPTLFEPLSLYTKYVKNHPCLLHPNRKSVGHHFPRTKGAGADDWKKIPLCPECHNDYHVNSKEFLWLFKDQIADFFYKLIEALYSNLNASNDIIQELLNSKE